MSSRKEVPGNVLASHALVQREMLAVANALYVTMGRIEQESDPEVAVKAFRFVAPSEKSPEWLAVVTADTENGRIVAFHKDDTFVQCVRGVCTRFNNGSLKWKEDQYE